ncbi:MAG: helix-turn-helix domain-containing protein [Deltaproteobacteria bacterium]|nr:helix-turn-helix domain-containing protein [Deltaproteobacteria bacterium]
MKIELATKQDLIDFKEEILQALKKNEDPPFGEKLMDREQVCQYLNITPSTFYKYRDRLPIYKICGKWQAKKSEIDKFITKNRIL